jgi:serine/threonine protein kinase
MPPFPNPSVHPHLVAVVLCTLCDAPSLRGDVTRVWAAHVSLHPHSPCCLTVLRAAFPLCPLSLSTLSLQPRYSPSLPLSLHLSTPLSLSLAPSLSLSIPTMLQFVPTPLASLIPHASPEAIQLLQDLLHYDPAKRPTAAQVLQYPFFLKVRGVDGWVCVVRLALVLLPPPPPPMTLLL